MLPSVTAGGEHAYTVLLSFDKYELYLLSFIITLFYSIHFVISNKTFSNHNINPNINTKKTKMTCTNKFVNTCRKQCIKKNSHSKSKWKRMPKWTNVTFVDLLRVLCMHNLQPVHPDWVLDKNPSRQSRWIALGRIFSNMQSMEVNILKATFHRDWRE